MQQNGFVFYTLYNYIFIPFLAKNDMFLVNYILKSFQATKKAAPLVWIYIDVKGYLLISKAQILRDQFSRNKWLA